MNSILQTPAFKSGVSIGAGLTTESQSFVCDGIKYMDTPGLSDVRLREQAARQIEKALKEDNKYKIVFVITLEGGRIKPDDLTTINLVCDAVKAEFNYGIVINKVTKQIENRVNSEPGQWLPYLEILKKKPSSFVIINKNEDMEDTDNVYLSADSPNRKKLLDFIAALPSNGIPVSAIDKIKENEYEQMKEEFSRMLNSLTQQINDLSSQIKDMKADNEKLADTNKDLQKELAEERNKKCIVM